MTLQGSDLSSIQQTPDFANVKARGASFVVLRCGNGNNPPDRTFASRKNAAMAAGLTVGVYHVVFPLPDHVPGDSRNPLKQAAAHFAASGGHGANAGELPPSIDFEWPDPADWTKWGCAADQIRAWCKTYLTEAERLHGVTPLLYTSPYFCQQTGLAQDPFFARFPLWLSEYTLGDRVPTDADKRPPAPAPWTSWAIWQSAGGVARLSDGERVDSDVIDDPAVFAGLLTRPLTMPVLSY